MNMSLHGKLLERLRRLLQYLRCAHECHLRYAACRKMLSTIGMKGPAGVTQSVLRLGRDTEAGVRAFRRSKQWREAAKVCPCLRAGIMSGPLACMIHTFPALTIRMPSKLQIWRSRIAAGCD